MFGNEDHVTVSGVYNLSEKELAVEFETDLQRGVVDRSEEHIPQVGNLLGLRTIWDIHSEQQEFESCDEVAIGIADSVRNLDKMGRIREDAVKLRVSQYHFI